MRNRLSIVMFLVAATAATAHAGDDTAKKPATGGGTGAAAIKPAEPPPEAPQPPALPKPAPELLATAKAVKGTWTCRGDMFGPDGKSLYKTKMTVKIKLDLASMWLRADYKEAKNKKSKRAFAMTAYRTYDATAKKWASVDVDNYGGTGTGWSTGPDATGKVTWEGERTMGGQSFRERHYEEPGTKKGSIRMRGEMSPDGGKSWMSMYDVTCTK